MTSSRTSLVAPLYAALFSAALSCVALPVGPAVAAQVTPQERDSQGHGAHGHQGHAAQGAGTDHQHEQAETGHEDHQGSEDPHAHHRAMMGQKDYKRSEHSYRLTDVKLTDMNGRETSLLAELDGGQPVMVNFIFTTCTTICPVMSATFAKVQGELGPDADAVRMVSISIDPEYDTPGRLRAYASLFHAGDQWQFLTGNLDDIIAVQKAFDVYRGNKMNHEPTTLLRASPGDPWVRLDGIASAADIVSEYERLVGR
jgi:protein SCO1/2